MYQGRYFGQANDRPRYSTKGQSDTCYHIIGEPSVSILVVEDCVSAIKVSRVAQVMPLWGSQLSYDRIIKLSNRFEELVVWLDRDKANYALRAHLKASLLFDRVRVVITNKDPKEYNETEIRKHLGQHASPIGFH
jgi:DNA primase